MVDIIRSSHCYYLGKVTVVAIPSPKNITLFHIIESNRFEEG